MCKWGKLISLTLLSALAAAGAAAKVAPEEAAKLGIEGTELTPMGAVRAGNADGSIDVAGGAMAHPACRFLRMAIKANGPS